MFEAYKIGITLSLTNHVSRGLMLMANDFAKTEAQATLLEKRIKSIQSDALKGGLLLGAGMGILALFKAPLEEAKKFDQALGKFKLLGLSDAQNADAVKFVRSMDTMGTSYVDNMKLMTEAQGVFRESGLLGAHALEGAKIATPMLAKIQFASAALDDESKARMHTQSLAMLRFVEMRGGLKDAATFNNIADAGWKAVQSSGGNVNFEQLRQFMARGGVAAQGLSDVSLFAKLEPIIGELKGSTAGNAWMTSYNRLVGGVRIPNQIAHLLADNGIWDKSKVEWNSMGGIKRFNGNPLQDMKTFASDPVEFYEKNILPMYARMNGGKGLDIAERSRENTMIFGRTGGMMFSLIDRQLETIHRSVGAWEKAMTVDGSVKIAGGTLAGKEVDLDAKWKKVKNDLGNVILPFAISTVEKLASGLKGLAGWIERNQGLTKLFVGALAVLAGGLMIRGIVLLASAAFRGLGLALLFGKAGGIGGIKSLASGIGSVAVKFGELAGRIPGVTSTLSKLLRILPVASVPTAVVAGGVGATLFATGVVGANKKAFKGISENPMLSAMSGDTGLAAAIMNANDDAAETIKAAAPKRAAASPFIAPFTKQPVQIINNTYLDGKLISQSVVEKVVNQMSRPAAGLSSFDPRAGFVSPSQAY